MGEGKLLKSFSDFMRLKEDGWDGKSPLLGNTTCERETRWMDEWREGEREAGSE
jgi:hypothetical protein